MREIIFRGKRNSGEWVYGSLVYSATIQPAIYFEVGNGTAKAFDWCYVDPDTVGQFVGLCDKHGNKIFEGDIVGIAAPYTSWYVVKFVDGMFFASLANKDESYESRPLWVVADKFSVIGNIYDKKEGE